MSLLKVGIFKPSLASCSLQNCRIFQKCYACLSTVYLLIIYTHYFSLSNSKEVAFTTAWHLTKTDLCVVQEGLPDTSQTKEPEILGRGLCCHSTWFTSLKHKPTLFGKSSNGNNKFLRLLLKLK